ncbi:TolC family protein [Novosphingobium cyanobacteriorum]|uniref:TolC family protein n=1 Tax=Novosphingobium cyanobacteriorum TaxID=3024215 RepID=A0ABT6CNH1_9SPHN|nr:TolC family protein [Novosphingobium cyanobacteriorum]MDF8335458.1 TolC family protein [Novosphingobium cyanobacteriorum]
MRRLLILATLLATTGQNALAQENAPADGRPAASASPPSENAQPTAGAQAFTLEQALAAAGTSSPGLNAAAADVRAAEAGRRVAGLRPNPEVQIQVENVGGTGQFRGTQSAETTTGLALPIELGGKRSARIAVADAQTDRARIEAAIAVADLTLNVTEAYVLAIAAERRVEISKQEADFATIGFRAASARVTAGAASPIEQQRADVLRINADVALGKAQRDAIVARANLGRLIGQPVSAPLDRAWFERIEGYGPVEPIAAQGTLALAAAEADLSIASAQVRLARSQRVPDITLTAGARRLSASNDTAAIFGVSIPFPLFNRGRATLDQASALESASEARRRVALIESDRQIAAAQAIVANAAATARAAGGPGLEAAFEAARIAAIGYANGKFSQLDLIEAQRTLAQTRAAYVEALATYHTAQAELARLITPAPVARQVP